MARVRSFGPSKQNVKAHPTAVDCEYQTIADDDDRRLLHLTTFGSDEREAERKSSQSLQLDLEGARKLVAIIQLSFPEIAAGQQLPGTNAECDTENSVLGADTFSAQNSGDALAYTLIEAAATSIAGQLRENIQSSRWDAVLSRAADLLHGSTPRDLGA